jgi:hypothetical protein
MQANRWQTKTKVNEIEKKEPRSINRQIAPCVRERKKRINHQTKYFVARERERGWKQNKKGEKKKKLYMYN